MEEFDGETWREGERKVAREGVESGWEVFERWGKLGDEEGRDWEAVVSGIGTWDGGKVCALRVVELTLGGREEREGGGWGKLVCCAGVDCRHPLLWLKDGKRRIWMKNLLYTPSCIF